MTGKTGLRVFDRDGNIILDFTDRVSKVIKTGTVQFNSWMDQRQTISVKGLDVANGWIVAVTLGKLVTYGKDSFTIYNKHGATDYPYTVVHYSVIRL